MDFVSGVILTILCVAATSIIGVATIYFYAITHMEDFLL